MGRSGTIALTGARRARPLLAAAAVATILSGCRIVSIEEDRALRARHGAGFDAVAEVGRLWAGRALPALDRAAVPMATLLPAIAAGADAAGARLGRRTGEGAPWTFVGRGTGIVTAADTRSRRGTVEVALDGLPSPRTIRLQVGPVVTGTAIRDALPFLAFNDFADQLAFADVGRALTARAMAAVRPAAASLRPGAHVRFTGAFNLRAADDPVLLTPVTLGPAPARAG